MIKTVYTNRTEKTFIILLLFLTINSLFATVPQMNFSGRFSGLGQVSNANDRIDFNVRYLPQLEVEFFSNFDAEFSGNIYSFASSNAFGEIAKKIKPYRGWIRYRSAQVEIRLGLQKINFGPARILRSLSWFEQLDPKDPLQFADGVNALRMQYYFQNNANVWLWGLYGNDNPKGLEMFGTKENTPEFGGRFQYPFGNAELAVTAHHRTLLLDGIAENRIALDGFWDAGVGLWFESVVIQTDYEENKLDYRTFLTLGTDYTFPVGNGVTATAEHLRISMGETLFDDQSKNDITAVSLSYPLGMMDRLSCFSYYSWDSDTPFHYFSWQRTYDRWIFQLNVYWSLEVNSPSFTGKDNRELGTNGFQFMVIFNH